MTERSFYKNTFSNFLNTSVEDFIGKMTLNDEGICETEQINAWKEEYKIMKVTLAPWEKDYGEILFEYSIPRLGKRIDVVLLLRGIVFTIEFKVGQKSYLPADKEQVMDYALDLKYFHQASHDRTIVPILVATKAKKKKYVSFPVYHDNIYKPISSNSKQLQSLIKKVIEKVGDVPPEKVDFTGWEDSRYAPTPTIIEAASSLYHNHTVTDIAHSEADKGKLEETTNYISLMSTKKWTWLKVKQIWFTWTNLIFEIFNLRLIE